MANQVEINYTVKLMHSDGGLSPVPLDVPNIVQDFLRPVPQFDGHEPEKIPFTYEYGREGTTLSFLKKKNNKAENDLSDIVTGDGDASSADPSLAFLRVVGHDLGVPRGPKKEITVVKNMLASVIYDTNFFRPMRRKRNVAIASIDYRVSRAVLSKDDDFIEFNFPSGKGDFFDDVVGIQVARAPVHFVPVSVAG